MFELLKVVVKTVIGYQNGRKTQESASVHFFRAWGCRLNFEISLFRDTFYLLSVNNVHRSVKLI